MKIKLNHVDSPKPKKRYLKDLEVGDMFYFDIDGPEHPVILMGWGSEDGHRLCYLRSNSLLTRGPLSNESVTLLDGTLTYCEAN